MKYRDEQPRKGVDELKSMPEAKFANENGKAVYKLTKGPIKRLSTHRRCVHRSVQLHKP